MKFGKIAKITTIVAAVAIVTATAATATVYAVSGNHELASVTAAAAPEAKPAAVTTTAPATTALLATTTPAETEKKETKKSTVDDLTIYIVSDDAADTHKKTVEENLKQYKDFSIVYDANARTLSYDGKSVCYLEDVVKGGKSYIYTFDNSAKNALYLSIVRGENGKITGVKKISKRETVGELNNTKNITILGIPEFGDLDIDGFDSDFRNGFKSKNITDFSAYESLGFSYDKEKDVLTYKGETVSNFVDTSDGKSVKLYSNYTDGIGKSVVVIEEDGVKKVVNDDWTCFLDGFEGFGGFNGSGIWAMKDNDQRLVGFEIVTPDMTEYEAFGLVTDTEKETITFNGKNVASVDDGDNGGLLIFANGSSVNGAIGVDVIRDKDGKITKIVENDHVKINVNGKMTAEERAALKKDLEAMGEELKSWATSFKDWGSNFDRNDEDFEDWSDWQDWEDFEDFEDWSDWGKDFWTFSDDE